MAVIAAVLKYECGNGGGGARARGADPGADSHADACRTQTLRRAALNATIPHHLPLAPYLQKVSPSWPPLLHWHFEDSSALQPADPAIFYAGHGFSSATRSNEEADHFLRTRSGQQNDRIQQARAGAITIRTFD